MKVDQLAALQAGVADANRQLEDMTASLHSGMYRMVLTSVHAVVGVVLTAQCACMQAHACRRMHAATCMQPHACRWRAPTHCRVPCMQPAANSPP